MKPRLIAAIILALVLSLGFSTVASAAVPQSVIDAIIKDASDGTIDGHWTKEQIQAALDYLAKHPKYKQYSDWEGTLEDYLSSERTPGEHDGGKLAFTGGEIFLLLGAGAGMLGGGVLLRRRQH